MQVRINHFLPLLPASSIKSVSYTHLLLRTAGSSFGTTSHFILCFRVISKYLRDNLNTAGAGTIPHSHARNDNTPKEPSCGCDFTVRSKNGASVNPMHRSHYSDVSLNSYSSVPAFFPEAQFAGYSSPTDKTVPPAPVPSYPAGISYISLCFLPEFLFWHWKAHPSFSCFALFWGGLLYTSRCV